MIVAQYLEKLGGYIFKKKIPLKVQKFYQSNAVRLYELEMYRSVLT